VISKSLYVQLLIRVLLMAVASVALGWIIAGPPALILAVVPLVILVAVILNTVLYLNRVNRRLFYFFDAIKNEDTTLSFPPERNNRILNDLNRQMLNVNAQIQEIYAENQKQEKYFQALIEHAATGIFTFNKKGFVLHSNRLARELFGLPYLTHLTQLEVIDGKLYRAVREIQQGNQRLTALHREADIIQLLIKASAFISGGEELMLVSVQDIKHQLDEKEIESWRKLIRVMMHEIMNSVTPINSLSESLKGYFYKGKKVKATSQIDEKTIETTLNGLDLIHEQGKGLLRFVESYRRLTRLPDPDIKTFPVRHLIDNILLLAKAFPNAGKIELQCRIDPRELELPADEKLVSQVLVNLMKNAFEALAGTDDARVMISADRDREGQTVISISDNGPGIPEEVMDKVFIPFFTTRENGSGIGLSLSRQIMQMHGGSLRITSVPGDCTTAALVFPYQNK